MKHLRSSIILWSAALALGLVLGLTLRNSLSGATEHLADDRPNLPGARKTNGNAPGPAFSRAMMACQRGEAGELIEALNRLGSGAEEQFEPWIRQAIRNALARQADPVNLYLDVCKVGTKRSVNACLEVLGELAPASMEKFLTLLTAQEDTWGMGIEALFKGMGVAESLQAIDIIATLPARKRADASIGILRGLVEKDPAKALKLAKAGLPDLDASSALKGMFWRWYALQPQTAAAAITPELLALSPSLGVFVISDRVAQGASFAELKSMAGKSDALVNWKGLLKYTMEQGAAHFGVEQALALLQEPDVASLKEARGGVDFLAMSLKEGAGKALEALPVGKQRDGILRGVLDNLALHDPNAAMRFLAQESAERPSSDLQANYEHFCIAWLNNDPTAALAALESSADPNIQSSLKKLIQQHSGQVDWKLVDAARAVDALPVTGRLKEGLVPEGGGAK